MPNITKRAPHPSSDPARRIDDPWLAAAIDGTGRNDKLTGTAADDFFDVSQGGNDTVKALAGNDTARYGSTFTAKDLFDGGDGFDSIELSGSYAGLTVTGAMLKSVESFDLFAGGSYDVTFAKSVGDAIDYLQVYVYPETPSTVTVDASALTVALVAYTGSGDDRFSTGAGNDLFRATGGGTDHYDGGAGYNRISFYGVVGGVTFDLGSTGAQQVGSGTVAVRNVADASGTAEADTLTGTAGDNWLLGSGGNDLLIGLSGDDYLVAGRAPGGGFPTGATVDGGRGFDTLDLNSNGGSTGGATFSLAVSGFQNTGQGVLKAIGMEAVSGTGFADTLTGDKGANSLFGGGGADTINGGAGADLIYGDGFYTVDSGGGFDGPRVIDENPDEVFADTLIGGQGDDTIIAGAGADTLNGGLGKDRLTGGQGADLFVYVSTADSAGRAVDTILDFSRGEDRIDVSAIDADTTRNGNQAFRLGATADHAGDVVVHFEAAKGVTIVDLFTDGDAKADMTISLSGDVALTAADFIL